MNPEGDNTPIDMVFKILQFQEENKDISIPGTSYSSHFIDVQLKSLLSIEDFSPDLFLRLMDITVDSNVCKYIWTTYQELISKVIKNLAAVDLSKDEELPPFTPNFLRILARLLRTQVESNGKGMFLSCNSDIITCF
jgi:hypothetical protein